MRVVVTGAAGFIGRNVLLRAPREWEIFAVYRGASDLDQFVKQHGLAHVRPIKCDLLSAGDVNALTRTIGRKPDRSSQSKADTTKGKPSCLKRPTI